MAFQLIRAVYRQIRYGQPVPWHDFNPFAGVHSLSGAVLPTVLVIGLLNLIGMGFFSKAEIGSFYEKSSYRVDYDALLEINGDTTIFCIATVEHDEGYRIVKLSLPYGKEQFPDDSEFKQDSSPISLRLGHEGWRCELTLDALATETSYEALNSYGTSSVGDFCASKKSDTYHLKGCSHIKSIKEENLIYFKYCSDAEVLGYTMCRDCQERY